MNFYSFHIGDYAAHTRRLSLTEDLAYRRMIDEYYLQEAPLDLIPAAIARRIGMREHVADVEYVLSQFFELQDDGWHNVRCDKEIEIYHAKLEQASRAGRASAESRKRTGLTKNQRASNTRSTDVQPTNNQEPITNNQLKTKSITPPIGVDASVWNDFVAHRKSKRAAISATALKGIESEARKAGISLQAALEMCVMRGWTGFKAEWIEEKKTASDKSKAVLSGLTRGIMGGGNAGLLTV